LKTITLNKIVNLLEKEVPLQVQESYDNSGLVIGNINSEISGTLLSIDVTEEVIKEAIKKKCNLILAHHPLIFTGLKKLRGDNYVERTVLLAIENKIAIYAMHTNLDVMPYGVSYKMAEKLQLQNIRTLKASNNSLKKLVSFVPNNYAEKIQDILFNLGAGKIGNYSNSGFSSNGEGTFKALEGSKPFIGELNKQHTEKETRIETIFPSYLEETITKALVDNHPYEEPAYDIYTLDNKNKDIGLGKIGTLPKALSPADFLNLLKTTFSLQGLRYSNGNKDKISTIAVCGGSCSFLIKDTLDKTDAFVTADIKYHEFFDADNQVLLADIGHYESEQFSKEIFYDIINKKFPNFAIHFSDINTNPINYL